MTTSVPDNRRLTPRRKQILLGAGVVLIPVIAWLAFGYFGIQAAFIDNEVSEEGPVFASGAVATGAPASAGEIETGPDTEGTEVEVEEPEMEEEAMEETGSDDATAAESGTEMAEPTAEPEILMPYAGRFSGNSRYEVTGDALVLTDGTEQRFLRFEDFDASNGPDLNVYLRAQDGSFVDLGDLKGNIGDQNYEIPSGVDLSLYSSVEIWCVRFGVGFGQAELMAT